MFNWFKRKHTAPPNYQSICPNCFSLSERTAEEEYMCSLCDSEFVTTSFFVDLNTFLNNHSLEEMRTWVAKTEEAIRNAQNANARWYAKDHLKALQRLIQLKS